MTQWPLPLRTEDITEEAYRKEVASLSWLRRFIARWTPFLHPDVQLRVRLLSDLVFIDRAGKVWVIPQGMECDYASVPRHLQGVASKTGPANKAFVLHDFLYASRILGKTDKGRERSDELLKEAMLSCGEDAFTSQMYYESVRLGGAEPYFNRSDDSASNLCYLWIEARRRIGVQYGPLAP